jgi:hypothetical protein
MERISARLNDLWYKYILDTSFLEMESVGNTVLFVVRISFEGVVEDELREP